MMKFGRPSRRNSAPEISDLHARIDADAAGNASLRLHLTMGHAELELENREFTVGTVEALLHIECEGLEVDQWSILGQQDRSGSRTTKVVTEAVDRSHAKAEGSLGIGIFADVAAQSASATASLGVGGGVEKQATQTATTNEEIVSRNVIAEGGNRWRVREAGNAKTLKGRYLGDEDLCSVRSVAGSNRQRLLTTLEVKQRHLVFDPSPDGLMGTLLRSRTADKLKAILLTKSLHDAIDSERSFAGKLVLSVVECEVSDDGESDHGE